MGLNATGSGGLVTNNIGNRFSGSSSDVSGNHVVVAVAGSQPPAEEEGLGSKLQSLLESALNGQISRSPTRSTILSADAGSNCISPLVSSVIGDSQSGSENVLLSEQLREFESVFERVAGSTRVEPRSDWSTELANQEDAYGHAPYLAPPSNFSETMDVSDASPHRSPLTVTSPLPIPSPSSEDRNNTCPPPEGGVDAETEAPLMQLLTVASAARQALEDEEKSTSLLPAASPASEASGISPTLPAPLAEEQQQQQQPQQPQQPQQQQQQQQDAAVRVEDVATASVPELVSVPVAAVNVTDINDGSQPAMTATTAAAPTTPTTTTAAATTATTPAAAAAAATSSNASAPTSGGKVDNVKANRNRVSNKSSPVVSPGSSSPSKTSGSASGSGSGSAAAGAGSASAAAPKAPQKAHDDEHTVSRVNAILEEYKEQLRNSPDLQNKPAPRRYQRIP